MSSSLHRIRRNIGRVAGMMGLLLVALMVTLIYWQVVAADRLLDHPHNRRLAWREQRIHRGGIYDRNGAALAQSDFTTGEQVRQYPLGEAAALVVGYQSVRLARSGLEDRYQAQLSGLSVDRGLAEVRDRILGRRAHGDEVFTTLDAELQRAAFAALRGRRGAVVAVEPATGALRCLASSPSFSPDSVDEDWDSLRVADDHPLLNRATQGLYPPGSTFKVVTAAAALETGAVSNADRFECTGTREIEDYKIRCEGNRAHGSLDLTQALVVSCNCTFGLIATQVGSAPLQQMADRFGLDSEPRLEIPARTSTVLRRGQAWFTTLLAQTGFGQGQLSVTPLQMALVAATIANGGRQAPPYLVDEVRTYEGRVVQRHRSSRPRQVLSETTAEKLVAMMAAVVQKGSTRRVFGDLGVTVAGKTGTAQNPHGRAHAWFIAFAPVVDPTLAVAVVLENAGSGSKVAAPVARKVLETHIRRAP